MPVEYKSFESLDEFVSGSAAFIESLISDAIKANGIAIVGLRYQLSLLFMIRRW